MTKITKSIILIDGQNLFHTLKDFKLKERDLDWNKLFTGCLDGPNDEILAAYWFRPKEISEIYLTKKKISINLFHKKYPRRKKELDRLFHERNLPPKIFSEIESIYNQNRRWLSDQKNRFEGIRRIYFGLSKRYSEIQLYESGFLKVDPYIQQILGEKGVDVAVAVKLVELSLTDACDKVILFSGDLDFYEAIKLAKDNGKVINVVMFEGKRRVMAEKIKRLADSVIRIKEVDLKKRYYIGNNSTSIKKTDKIDEEKRIKRFIIQNDLDKAIERIEKLILRRDEEFENISITLKAQIHAYESARIKGTKANAELNVDFSKIRESVLWFLSLVVKKYSKK